MQIRSTNTAIDNLPTIPFTPPCFVWGLWCPCLRKWFNSITKLRLQRWKTGHFIIFQENMIEKVKEQCTFSLLQKIGKSFIQDSASSVSKLPLLLRLLSPKTEVKDRSHLSERGCEFSMYKRRSWVCGGAHWWALAVCRLVRETYFYFISAFWTGWQIMISIRVVSSNKYLTI